MPYYYHIPPIDHWTGAITRSELLAVLSRGISDTDRDHDDRKGWHQSGWHEMISLCKNLSEFVEQAEAAFTKIGWEGDYAGGAFYFSLPTDNQMAFGYIVKQSNNGSCFVASPHELPHIAELSFKQATTE